MQQFVLITCGLLLSLHSATAVDRGPLTPQAERGREIFLKSQKGTACAVCHSLAGAGTAIGPDLTTLASAVGPRGLVMTFKMTVYAYVKDFKMMGETFPGIEKRKVADLIEVWDLGQKPPLLRTLQSNKILSTKQTQTWKHPPAAAGYTPQELADLVGFLKWAATGSQTEISPADGQATQ